MGRLDGRLSRLEAGAGVEECHCTGVGPRVLYENDWRALAEHQVAPEVCARCGRPRVTVRVVYVDNWRSPVSNKVWEV